MKRWNYKGKLKCNLIAVILFSVLMAQYALSETTPSLTVDFVSPPTPLDGAILTEHTVNVTLKGIASSYYEDVSISNAWIEWNGVNKPMSGGGYSWSYANNTLDKGGYAYRVYVNDTFGNVNTTTQRTFSVPSYEIVFNVTSGEDGSGINNIDSIVCDYSGFSKGIDNSNPYGSYVFPAGVWSCTFEKSSEEPVYWNETKSFTSNADKTVDVVMSLHGGLSHEENTQLDWLYRCWRYGECDAYTMVAGTYQNVSRIWAEFIPTNVSVVANEIFISKTLSASSNITINYTVYVPYKKGVEDKSPLPIRIFYWFTDASGKCYNQDKQNDSNRAETPFCIPLIAEYLGPNNGSVNFPVALHPNLPDGTYEVVRQIDIDPPVNGMQTWINYGRGKIGSIDVVNKVKTPATSAADNNVPSTAEATAPHIPGLTSITGRMVSNMLDKPSFMLGAIVMLLIISLFGNLYWFMLRRKQ